MKEKILKYCEENNIEYLFLDFFDTIVQRKCSPEEIKYCWAKKLALKLQYAISEDRLISLRKKSEQAVILRAESGEFEYGELIDEVYRRIVILYPEFGANYSEQAFRDIAYDVEIQAELENQRYIAQTMELIHAAFLKGLHINIVSDFYLGQNELKTFLKKDGIHCKIDHIFVSSECKATKHQGKLYEYVCHQLGADPIRCVMVGDNLQSDVQKAEACGIKGFLMKQSKEKKEYAVVAQGINHIAQTNISGTLRYSNYCFLLYLYAERLYKTVIRKGIKDIYFLSREGEFLKKIFDLYITGKSDCEIRTHYLYVSRKATYPATLKPLDEEDFRLLRKTSTLSPADFFENIGIPFATKYLTTEGTDNEEPILDFFNSEAFQKLCAREDFREVYELSRTNYNRLFQKYCKQEGLRDNSLMVFADVGWNGTMQDNISCALDAQACLGIYIGLRNAACLSEKNQKIGLIFSEIPLDSRDFNLWKYDYTFLERLLSASHGATDHYKEDHTGVVTPVLKEYASEAENYKLLKPIQEEILTKVQQLDALIGPSCYCAEDFYKEFLDRHLRMLFKINNKQINLQRALIRGQMQNFGHFTTAEQSIGATFSKRNIIRKFWNRLRVLKNTEIVFRILLNYNQYFLIKLLYYFHYIHLKR